MRCPFCNSSKIRVIDKRPSDDRTIRRRRECIKCKKRFTTYERVDFGISVVKRDGRREPFDRNKLKIGIMKACEKRPISLRIIEKMVDEVESNLRANFGPEVKSSVIGDIVMDKIKDADEIAYVRFASYYKQFKDVKSFEKVLKELREKQ